MWKNTDTEFGLTAKLLHWGMVVYLLALFGFGRYIATMNVGFDNLHLIGLHKSFGLVALLLIIFRLGWRFFTPVPGTLTRGTSKFDLLLAHLTHMALYALMLAIPLTGWIASSASGIEISFFGWFNAPLIAPASEWAQDMFFKLHWLFGRLLILFVLIHIAGALRRHFVLRDKTLRRMWF
jgi:cytochrome b561